MKQLDPRLTAPAVMDYTFKSCTITSPEGEVVPGMIGRISCSDNGKVEFFEASEVFPAEFKGEKVLVDYPEMKLPIRLFKRRKDGTFRTDKKKGVFYSVKFDETPTKVLTYHLLAFPDEAIAKLTKETATAMRELEARQIEAFLSKKG